MQTRLTDREKQSRSELATTCVVRAFQKEWLVKGIRTVSPLACAHAPFGMGCGKRRLVLSSRPVFASAPGNMLGSRVRQGFVTGSKARGWELTKLFPLDRQDHPPVAGQRWIAVVLDLEDDVRGSGHARQTVTRGLAGSWRTTRGAGSRGPPSGADGMPPSSGTPPPPIGIRPPAKTGWPGMPVPASA